MNTDYQVGDLIYDAGIYDGLNTFHVIHKFGSFEEAFDDNSGKQIFVCQC